MWGLSLAYIKGLMFGIEYTTDPQDGTFYVVLDVGFLRFMYYSVPEGAEQ